MRRRVWILVAGVVGVPVALGTATPASAQIFETTTTTSQPTSTSTSSTSSTLLPTSTTRPSTTTTGSTSTTRGDSTSTTGSSTSTSRGSTTTAGETTTTFTILPGPTTAPDEPAAEKSPGGSGEINAVFPMLSALGFLTAIGLVGMQWHRTRDSQE